MAVMRAARGTETVVMLAISFNGDRGDSQSCDPENLPSSHRVLLRTSVDVDLVDSKSDAKRFAGLLDADDVARHVDVRVVAADVTEHQPQGQHLPVDETVGGFEADAVLTDIDGRPDSVRGFDRKLHVVPRRPAAFRADVRGWRHPRRTKTKPAHLSVRTAADPPTNRQASFGTQSKKATKGRRRRRLRLYEAPVDSERLSSEHCRLQPLAYRGAAHSTAKRRPDPHSP